LPQCTNACAAALRIVVDRSPVLVKFHLSTSGGHTVTGSGPGWVRVDAEEYRENLILTPDTVVAGWAQGGFEGLTVDDFKRLLASAPDVVLLGSGSAIRFPPAHLAAVLMEAHVGLEVMDTPAACRTFNILAAEGRRVAAGLIVV
jgi:uncharacterized protein